MFCYYVDVFPQFKAVRERETKYCDFATLHKHRFLGYSSQFGMRIFVVPFHADYWAHTRGQLSSILFFFFKLWCRTLRLLVA